MAPPLHSPWRRPRNMDLDAEEELAPGDPFFRHNSSRTVCRCGDAG